MPTTDPRIDAYIAKAAPFAQPVLNYVRDLVHRTLPQVEEGIKWGMPAFMIGGKNVAGLAAFKAHCAVMIHGERRLGESEGMGGYGKVTALSDLPDDDVLEASLKEAAERVATTGTARKPAPKKPPKAEISMPDDFAAALALVPKAKVHLEGFAPGQRREYLEWITRTARTRSAHRERMSAERSTVRASTLLLPCVSPPAIPRRRPLPPDRSSRAPTSRPHPAAEYRQRGSGQSVARARNPSFTFARDWTGKVNSQA